MFQPEPNKKKEGTRKKFLLFPFQTVPESLEPLDVSEGEKKEGIRNKFLSFPFWTIPESLETLDVSEGKKSSFLLGRRTRNLVRVRRL